VSEGEPRDCCDVTQVRGDGPAPVSSALTRRIRSSRTSVRSAGELESVKNFYVCRRTRATRRCSLLQFRRDLKTAPFQSSYSSPHSVQLLMSSWSQGASRPLLDGLSLGLGTGGLGRVITVQCGMAADHIFFATCRSYMTHCDFSYCKDLSVKCHLKLHTDITLRYTRRAPQTRQSCWSRSGTSAFSEHMQTDPRDVLPHARPAGVGQELLLAVGADVDEQRAPATARRRRLAQLERLGHPTRPR